MSGMLIGRLEATTTIDGSNYPDMSKYNIICNNVTVTYNEWANYTYCYEAGAGDRYARVEPGYSYGGVNVENCTHTDEHIMLVFDGLFGGDQYGVRPIVEYAGVNVIYNNK